ncbi:uncharacterized protein LOC122571793 [Bombus pyrosoma]|uniref:uncharacterized protein LOC122571793 n=1 Tax=Bombus pyrosoma TaxID=396416 RepID=UPI001CB90D00|nr:uncharacterized protein LOC122571793 [Bombus pyrosoma]
MMYHIRETKIYSANIQEENGFHTHLSRVSLLINSITLVLITIPHISVSINSIPSTAKIFHHFLSMMYHIRETKIYSANIQEQNGFHHTHLSRVSLLINSITLVLITIPHISVSINSIPSTVKIFHHFLSMMYHIRETKIYSANIQEQNGFHHTHLSRVSLLINSITLVLITIPHLSVSINSIPSTAKIFHHFLSMMYHIRETKIYSANIQEQNGFHTHLSRVSLLINSITLVLITIPHISVSINSIPSTAKIFHHFLSMMYHIRETKIYSANIQEQNGFHTHLSRVSLLINSITLVLITIPHLSVSINSIPSTAKIFHPFLSMMYRIGRTKINSGSIEEQNCLVAIRQEFSRTLFL